MVTLAVWLCTRNITPQYADSIIGPIKADIVPVSLMVCCLPHPANQVAAALLALQALPGISTWGTVCKQQHTAVTQQPSLSPEIRPLLQDPGISAHEVYDMWQEGVPLEFVGAMHSSNMPVSEPRGTSVCLSILCLNDCKTC